MKLTSTTKKNLGIRKASKCHNKRIKIDSMNKVKKIYI